MFCVGMERGVGASGWLRENVPSPFPPAPITRKNPNHPPLFTTTLYPPPLTCDNSVFSSVPPSPHCLHHLHPVTSPLFTCENSVSSSASFSMISE